LHQRCHPKQIPKRPPAHKRLENDNPKPASEGSDYGRIRVVVGVVERGPPGHTLLIGSKPKVLRAANIDV